MSTPRFAKVPHALRKARLDNLAIVPASLLLKKTSYQQTANMLPRGQVLIVATSGDSRKSEILRKVAAQLERKGQKVTTVESSRLSKEHIY